jgi:hypothetical protein
MKNGGQAKLFVNNTSYDTGTPGQSLGLYQKEFQGKFPDSLQMIPEPFHTGRFRNRPFPLPERKIR